MLKIPVCQTNKKNYLSKLWVIHQSECLPEAPKSEQSSDSTVFMAIKLIYTSFKEEKNMGFTSYVLV